MENIVIAIGILVIIAILGIAFIEFIEWLMKNMLS